MDAKSSIRPKHEMMKDLLDRLCLERVTGEVVVRFSQGSVMEAYTNLKAL